MNNISYRISKVLIKSKGYLIKAVEKGFFHILAGNTLVKIITFFSAMLLPRLLTKEEFGVLSYVDNIMSYILMLNGMGMIYFILRFCAMTDDVGEKKGLFLWALKVATIFQLMLIGTVYIVSFLIDFPMDDANSLVRTMLFLPFLMLFIELIQGYFRADLQNSKYSQVSVIFAFLMVVLQIIPGYFFRLDGVILGRYAAHILGIIIAILLLSSVLKHHKGIVWPPKSKYKEYTFYSISSMLAAAASIIMPINELFIVSNVLKDKILTANYRVASLIPMNITFLASSVIIFVYPYFAKKHNDGKWLLKNTFKLIAMLSIGLGLIVILGIIFTPQIISIVFGSKYADSSLLMRVFWISAFINSCIRFPVVNILAAIGKVKFNLINATISCVFHAAITYMLVVYIGTIGAAIGSCVAYLLLSVLSILYLVKSCNDKN